MKSIKLLTAVAIATSLVGCQKNLPMNGGVTDQVTVLEASIKYIEHFKNGVGANQLSQNVILYQNDPACSADMQAELQDENDGMAWMGFDNFTNSSVSQDLLNNIIFYPVLRDDENEFGNRNLCMAFFDGVNPDGPITVIEGPTSVGLGLVVVDQVDNFSSEQLANMFVPISELSQGYGSFEDGMATEESFRTKTGTVTIDYHTTEENYGIIELTAKSFATITNNPYDIKKSWKVKY